VGVADLGHGIGGELAELAGAQPSAGQHLDHEPVARKPMGAGGGHELGRVLVVEELRQRLGPRRDVAVEDGVAARGVGPVPFDEALEEDADHTQPLTLGVLRHGRALRPGPGGEPHLEVLDVGAGDVGHDGDVSVGGEPTGELSQREIGGIDAAGSQKRAQLDQ